MSLSRAMSFFTQSIMARSQMTFCDVAFSPHQKQLPDPQISRPPPSPPSPHKNQCKWTRRRHQLNKSIEKRKKKPRLPHALGTSIFFTRLQNNDRPPCCFSLPSPSVPSLFCYWLSWWIVDSKFVFDLLLFWSVLTARLILVSYYFAVGWLLRHIFFVLYRLHFCCHNSDFGFIFICFTSLPLLRESLFLWLFVVWLLRVSLNTDLRTLLYFFSRWGSGIRCGISCGEEWGVGRLTICWGRVVCRVPRSE